MDNQIEQNNKKVSLITPILDKLPYGSNIKNTAQNYYNELSQGLHKSNKRSQLAFFCILKALHDNEIYADPMFICKHLNMSKQSMHSSMSMAETDDKVIIRHPKDYIDYYINLIDQKFNITLSKERISGIIDRVMTNNPVAINYAPQSICYSVVYYYILLNNYNIPKDEYSKLCYVSVTCLKKMVSIIQKSDNM